MTHPTRRLCFSLLMLATIACKKQDEPAATAGYQAGTPGGAGAAATAVPTATSAPTTTAPAASATVDPTLLAAVTPMLSQLAASQTVAGSKALGAPIAGNVGGTLTIEQQILLQPNKCYSVVGVGMPPISELNVQIVAVTVIPGMAPVLATDQDVGASATLGKKPNCYKWAFPVPASVKVVVSAAGAQGVAAAQVYEK